MNRLVFAKCMALLLLVYAGGAVAQSPDTPSLAVGAQSVLFLDDRAIADSLNVSRIVHRGVKHEGPVLEPTEPCEGDRLYTMGTVYHDARAQEFRLWYMARTMDGSKHQDHVLYATSKDGVHWQKPTLGLHKFQGSAENNILLVDVHSPSVVITRGAGDEPAYKLMGMKYKAGGYITATSADGLRWTLDQPMPAISGGDNVTLTRDPLTGQYMSFHRHQRKVANHRRRSIFLSLSDDFENWSAPTPVLIPDARDDDAWVVDPERQRTEFYNMTVMPYDSQYIGFLTVCHFEPTSGGVKTANQSGTDGPIYVELTHSHDGRSWHRLEPRVPILSPGPAPWDGGMILSLSSPIVYNDEVWIYYTGFNTTHGGPRPPKQSAIGLAKWRLDGFVSLRARDGEVGIIETVAIAPTRRQLVVNANAEGGSLTAELLDQQGRTIPGYSREECHAIDTNHVRSTLRWHNHKQVPIDQPFAIRLFLSNAEVFSFSLQ